MRAIYVEQFNPSDPVAALVVGERPDPEPPAGWTTITLKAASLNHHDVWSLRGVGLRSESLPMVLGCDAAGLDAEGNEVIVHAVIDDGGGRSSLFSERHQGTFSQRVAVPAGNLLPKPPELGFEEAACLPTAWLTAYTMLFGKAELAPGDTVLIQGAGGGLSNALTLLAHAAGVRAWVTSRDEAKRAFAVQLGADAAFESGARLPERVDAVMDSVGAATWEHSLKSLRFGGAMVVSGGTSGYTAQAEVARIFALQLRILGSSMGSLDGLGKLARLCATTGLRPPIDRVLALDDAREGFAAMAGGDLRGKVVLTA